MAIWMLYQLSNTLADALPDLLEAASSWALKCSRLLDFSNFSVHVDDEDSSRPSA